MGYRSVQSRGNTVWIANLKESVIDSQPQLNNRIPFCRLLFHNEHHSEIQLGSIRKRGWKRFGNIAMGVVIRSFLEVVNLKSLKQLIDLCIN
jgi:hypothetical protein